MSQETPRQGIIEFTSLLRETIQILDEEISGVERSGNAIFTGSVSDIKASITLVTVSRSLQVFRDTLRFLVEKLPSESPDNVRFYLAHVRTLIDIYARLLHLCNVDDTRQATLCLVENLFTVAQLAKGPHSVEIIASYSESLKMNRPFIESAGLPLPEDPKQLDRQFIRDHKLGFPSVKNMLLEKHIVESAPETLRVFPTLHRNPYQFFAYFSAYSHGNSLLVGSRGTERFWVIGHSLLVTLKLIELIDIKMLQNTHKATLQDVLRKVHQKIPLLLQDWREENKKISAKAA